MNLTTPAKNWLALPPAQWSAMVKAVVAEKTKPPYEHTVAACQGGFQELQRELDSLACRAAMLAEYLSTRMGLDGCGKKDHLNAVGAANRKLVRVRNALGYTHPKSGTITF